MSSTTSRITARWFTRAALAAALLGTVTLGVGTASADPPHPIGCPPGFVPHVFGNGQRVCIAGNIKAKTLPQPGISVPLPPPSFTSGP